MDENTRLALHTDQYTLTMAQSFWRHGQDRDRASYELFVRRLPANRGYLVACGLDSALAYLEGLRFGSADLAFLESLGVYDDAFLDHLATLRFKGDVHAVQEGTAIGAGAPLLRVTASRLEATIVESALLAIINHQTMIASKSARIVAAGAGRPVWDFSLRRLHGPDAAIGVARASYIAGAAGSATVAAGRDLGIPTTGTMAHHYVQSFGARGELEAFKQFLLDYPENGVLLVDTYDTAEGVENAIRAARETRVNPKAVRLDSGDLAELAHAARRRLDEAGLPDTKILASNDLDEWTISKLIAAEAPIDAFGVGTMLGTSADAPHLGGVYKLVAHERDGVAEPVMKLAPDKRTDPGLHQLWRRPGHPDLLALSEEAGPPEATPLLGEVMRSGARLVAAPSLEEIRSRCLAELRNLPKGVLRLDSPDQLELERSDALIGLGGELLDARQAAAVAASTERPGGDGSRS